MRINKEKLNDAMASKGVFAKDLCKRLNMHESTLKKLLSDGGAVDAYTVSKIAYELNIPMGELEERTGKSDE
jgi:DNA-binding Xre family transcriptional regulator